MNTEANSINVTLNAKVAAVSLCVGAIALHILNQPDAALVPAQLIVLGIVILGAWAFSDEMGLRKPLNRVAIICFMFAMLAFAVSILEPAKVQYQLIYAFGLLFCVLFWSVAFLHRQRSLMVVGALGSVMTLVPLVILIIGHLSIAAGAFFGVEILYSASQDSQLIGTGPINTIEAVFVLWSVVTAVCLWRGKMSVPKG